MKREFRTVPSDAWGRPIEMLVYGDKGKPVMVFPSQEGRFFDYENFGMIEAIASFIDEGKIQVYCVDSLDRESWFAQSPPQDRARRANDYDYAIRNDVVPHILEDGHRGAGIIAHGCSFGAFHTVNFFLKHPDVFDIGIALSGCYDIGFALNGFFNQDVYFNNPIMYSKDLNDPKIVKQLQENLLIVCSGQGAWEEWIGEAQTLCKNLYRNNIPVLLDLWGYDVNHDWPWWKKMIVYFLGKLDRSGFLTSNHRMKAIDTKAFLENFHEI
ncbi:MAG: alpha/beta hydrolase-fold protein [Candidatus Rifleibacteriota bacterium]